MKAASHLGRSCAAVEGYPDLGGFWVPMPWNTRAEQTHAARDTAAVSQAVVLVTSALGERYRPSRHVREHLPPRGA
jgi:hypothetical protein